MKTTDSRPDHEPAPLLGLGSSDVLGPDGWPKLTKPARVGNGTFGVGVSARLVVEAAQRQHEYRQAATPGVTDRCRK